MIDFFGAKTPALALLSALALLPAAGCSGDSDNRPADATVRHDSTQSNRDGQSATGDARSADRGAATNEAGGGDAKSGTEVTTSWTATSEVDLGGKFVTEANVDLAINGSAFVATVNTTAIGDQAEAHTIVLKGSVAGTKLTITDYSFSVSVADAVEPVALSASFDTANDTITGGGTFTVTMMGSPIEGSFTLTKATKVAKM